MNIDPVGKNRFIGSYQNEPIASKEKRAPAVDQINMDQATTARDQVKQLKDSMAVEPGDDRKQKIQEARELLKSGQHNSQDVWQKTAAKMLEPTHNPE